MEYLYVGNRYKSIDESGDITEFSWYDAFVERNRYTDTADRYDLAILRAFIEKYGVNATDKDGNRVFDAVCFWKRVIGCGGADLIFEYKPNFPLFNGVYVKNYDFIQDCDCYTWGKFLEQDTEYRLLRHPFQYYYKIYPNFMHFMDKYIRKYGRREWMSSCIQIKFISMFRNHFNKGISFFELMKHRVFE